MKIRILNKNEHCFVRSTEDGLIFGDCCAEDCNMADDYHLFLTHNGKCVRSVVQDNESFFFTLTKFDKGYGSVAQYYGYFQDNELIIEEYIDGVDLSHEDGHVFLVSGFVPYKVYPRNKEFDSFILTADHMLTLGPDEFIGFKDGEIQNLSASEVLTSLSRANTTKSPTYKELRLEKSKTRPKRAKDGTIIYNTASKKLEFFSQGIWKPLKLED